MNKESFEEMVARIHKDELESKFLEILSDNELLAFFNIKPNDLTRLLYWYHLDHLIDQRGHLKRKAKYNLKAQEKLDTLIQLVTKDELIEYYITNNNSFESTQNYFNLTRNELLTLIKHYECKKPKTISKKLAEDTKQEKYGNSTYNNRESAKQTCLKKYGVENVAQVLDFQIKGYETKCINNGFDNPNNWKQGFNTRIQHYGSIEESYRQGASTRKELWLEKYGVSNPSKLPEVKAKIKESTKNTFQERYGVDCYWLTDDATRSNGSKNSSYNIAFAEILSKYNFNYSSEIRVGSYIYDFNFDNILIEINPYATHNSNWSPFSDKGISKSYHLNKTKTAREHGYRCIHIWDWDDQEKIVKSLLPKTPIYARKCEIKEVPKDICDLFLNEYHFQNTCRGQSIRYGLYYNDELIQVMTFGKPRYNKNYDYELLRLCTKNEYRVIGGSKKLFSHFLKNYSNSSIISYCDNSKFLGDVYSSLGMKLKDEGKPTRHWYHPKLGIHITDNFLRQRGFDQLFGDIFGTYGKGTSNEELMLAHEFVDIYDCGQSSYIWNNN